jgi:hypothetical protein
VLVGVFPALKGEILVDSLQCLRIPGDNPELAACGDRAVAIPDLVSPSRHGRGAGNRFPRVHHARRAEVPGGKLAGNLGQVGADLGDAGGIGWITGELDPPAVRQIFEPVASQGLHGDEGTVAGLGRRDRGAEYQGKAEYEGLAWHLGTYETLQEKFPVHMPRCTAE